MQRIGILICLALLLVACGQQTRPPTHSPEPVTGPDHQPPGTLSPVLISLQRDFEALDATHATISGIWDGLAAGEEAACGDYPTVLPPDSISAEGDTSYEEVADRLRRAAIDIDQVVMLWKLECMSPRPNPDPATIAEGRLASRAAGDSLRSAADLLAEIQP